MPQYSLFIDGRRTEAASGRRYDSVDPYLGQPWASAADGDAADVDAAVAAGHRGHRVAHALRTGTVWINAYRVVGPDVPFGGFGQSGLGRENGIEAVHEYTLTKAIWVELSGGTRDPFTLG
jgi:acyl-CoA reductase-like NAD-dependent aldehyde dehydrogenase